MEHLVEVDLGKHKMSPYYEITEDDTMLLIVGVTGAKAMGFKLIFIDEFRLMNESWRWMTRLFGVDRTS